MPPSGYLSGSTDPATSANGLPYASGGETLADTEGQSFTIRLARFVTDHDTGQTVLLLSDETVSAGSGYATAAAAKSFSITLDGVTVTLVDGAGNLPNGQPLQTYTNSEGVVSGTIAVFSYADLPYLAGEIDMEGFHAFGFETSPATIAAAAGTAAYSGEYYGFGQLLDGAGALIEAEVDAKGVIELRADFSRNLIGGAMVGRIEPAAGPARNYDAAIATTEIVGNGFGSYIEPLCGVGTACGSGSLIGGTFYGAEGQEISGVIGFDETFRSGGATERFVGAGGFTVSAAD